jgi:3-dehydroquinate dehydratase I
MICVSVEALDFDYCDSILRMHSFFEFRLDRTSMSKEELKQLFAMPNRMIATCRPGKFSDDKRLDILITAINAGAMYVDVENDANESYIKQIKAAAGKSFCKLILSYHNTETTPDEDTLRNTINACFSNGADIVKIACKSCSEKDNALILSLYKTYDKDKVILFGMGDKGKMTRLAATYLGAPFTYAALDRDHETAPGQIDFQNMKKIFDLMK